ncbi:sporulation protein Cse60 [Bacillus solimangrovi]|uniref:Sporulation protein cse60 n=1 Tax=Bacillus solimangrovi TaxID=1305675 RepID=A0A1E5LDG6_9BACI|nr:sporulation protein Cse60 [Bacillus solimangrovi]OEH92123.1 sporulation protein cse60 [Bacillus solimangrovi]
MLKVKLFDEQHESDLEEVVNEFLITVDKDSIRDIQFQTAVTIDDVGEQIFCFSAMVVFIEE